MFYLKMVFLTFCHKSNDNKRWRKIIRYLSRSVTTHLNNKAMEMRFDLNSISQNVAINNILHIHKHILHDISIYIYIIIRGMRNKIWQTIVAAIHVFLALSNYARVCAFVYVLVHCTNRPFKSVLHGKTLST